MIPWRREWLPTPVFVPGEFHGLRSLEGYSPWGCTELDTTELLSKQVLLSVKHKGFLKNLSVSCLFLEMSVRNVYYLNLLVLTILITVWIGNRTTLSTLNRKVL